MNKKIDRRQRFGNFISLFFIIICSFQTISAEGDILQLWVSTNTYHVDRANDEANFEQNQITSIFYDRWFFGSFINSYSRRSEILGYHYWYYPHQKDQLFYHYGVSLAVATGYGRELATNVDGRVTLGISPFAGVKYFFTDKWALGADVLYIPTDNGGVFVSGVNLNYRF